MKILYSHTSTPTYIRYMKNITALEQVIARMLPVRVDKSVGAWLNTCYRWGSEEKKLIAELESLSVIKC